MHEVFLRVAAARPVYARVVELVDATTDIRIVRLRVVHGGPFRFQAGQYARVTLGNHRPRDYSLASRPDDPDLEFHIRYSGGEGASAYAVRTLRVGEGVWLEGPFGDAWWRADHTGPVLAIAGGSGLAPIKSIVETALSAGPRRPIQVYFGARREEDVYLEEHFLALARRHPDLRFEVLLSEPAGPTRRRCGTPLDALRADERDLTGVKAYLAGPPAMIEGTVAWLMDAGLSPGDIHADPFYTEPKTPGAQPTVPR